MLINNGKIEKIISEEGFFVGRLRGHSMEPMLNCETDSVVIVPPSGRLKKYDVALYRSNGQYVLHRVVKVLSDSYVMCGDNCDFLEKGIEDKDIIGVLFEVIREGSKVDLVGREYQSYCRRRVSGFYFRRALRKIKRAVSKAIKKVLGSDGR